MGIGAGILIAAVGAVLRFAVTADAEGLDVQMIGTIMIIAGIAIAVIAAAFTASQRTRGTRGGVVYETDETTRL